MTALLRTHPSGMAFSKETAPQKFCTGLPLKIPVFPLYTYQETARMTIAPAGDRSMNFFFTPRKQKNIFINVNTMDGIINVKSAKSAFKNRFDCANAQNGSKSGRKEQNILVHPQASVGERVHHFSGPYGTRKKRKAYEKLCMDDGRSSGFSGNRPCRARHSGHTLYGEHPDDGDSGLSGHSTHLRHSFAGKKAQ
ncbi:MAG: hypothetical protein J5556_02090, partial [Deltaproteobacteria bacterium]|nr:hypothetical protein [Deltaproteobacteria bacterium]